MNACFLYSIALVAVACVSDILKNREDDKTEDFDVTTLSQQINHTLTATDFEFPPGGGIHAKYA